MGNECVEICFGGPGGQIRRTGLGAPSRGTPFPVGVWCVRRAPKPTCLAAGTPWWRGSTPPWRSIAKRAGAPTRPDTYGRRKRTPEPPNWIWASTARQRSPIILYHLQIGGDRGTRASRLSPACTVWHRKALLYTGTTVRLYVHSRWWRSSSPTCTYNRLEEALGRRRHWPTTCGGGAKEHNFRSLVPGVADSSDPACWTAPSSSPRFYAMR